MWISGNSAGRERRATTKVLWTQHAVENQQQYLARQETRAVQEPGWPGTYDFPASASQMLPLHLAPLVVYNDGNSRI
jgi:hypothetical protein